MTRNTPSIKPWALTCFLLQCLLALGLSVEHLHAKQLPDAENNEEYVNVQFINVDNLHGAAVLTPTSCVVTSGPARCSEGAGFEQVGMSGTLYSGGPQSIATVRLYVDEETGNWTITQNAKTPGPSGSCTEKQPCGGMANVTASWAVQSSTAIAAIVNGDVVATGLKTAGVADFTWATSLTTSTGNVIGAVGPFCLWASPFNSGPQCPVPQPSGWGTIVGTSAAATAFAAFNAPPPSHNSRNILGGQSYVSCSVNACNATATTEVDYWPLAGLNACEPRADVTVHSVNGTPTISAQFIPIEETLSQAAKACGFDHFDWQQWIINLACPSPYELPKDTSTEEVPLSNRCSSTTKTPGALMVGATGPYVYDPPPNGYAGALAGYDPAPYYYPKSIATSQCANNNINGVDYNPFAPDGHQIAVNYENEILSYSDQPDDPCLGSEGNTKEECGHSHVLAGLNYLEFGTALVGVNNGKSTPLAEWTWKDTFDGSDGGIAVTSKSGNVTLNPPAHSVPPCKAASQSDHVALEKPHERNQD